jgi:hypothetical protein
VAHQRSESGHGAAERARFVCQITLRGTRNLVAPSASRADTAPMIVALLHRVRKRLQQLLARARGG